MRPFCQLPGKSARAWPSIDTPVATHKFPRLQNSLTVVGPGPDAPAPNKVMPERSAVDHSLTDWNSVKSTPGTCVFVKVIPGAFHSALVVPDHTASLFVAAYEGTRETCMLVRNGLSSGRALSDCRNVCLNWIDFPATFKPAGRFGRGLLFVQTV